MTYSIAFPDLLKDCPDYWVNFLRTVPSLYIWDVDDKDNRANLINQHLERFGARFDDNGLVFKSEEQFLFFKISWV